MVMVLTSRELWESINGGFRNCLWGNKKKQKKQMVQDKNKKYTECEWMGTYYQVWNIIYQGQIRR